MPVAAIKPEVDEKIIKCCVSGIPKEETFKRLGSKRNLKSRVNKIYRIAYWLNDLHEKLEKNKNTDNFKIRDWKPLTYVKMKTTFHPAEIESIIKALKDAGWKPRSSGMVQGELTAEKLID